MARGKRNASIKDMFSNIKKRPTNAIDEDLEKALQLSRQEHLNEQKRLLEQFKKTTTRVETIKEKKNILKEFARLAQPQKIPIIPKRKRRIIQKDDDEDEDEEQDDQEDWFQTISSRPQQRIKLTSTKKVKKEAEKNQVLLDIDDVDSFLNQPDEPMKIEEASYDLTSFLSASDTEEQQQNNKETFKPMTSDSDTDCSVIDLSTKENIPSTPPPPPMDDHPQEEDDGYLSPLEGFTSVQDVQDNQLFYEQLRPTTNTRTRKKPATTKKSNYYKKRSAWKYKKRRT